mmetsp:Transcript_20564/g.55403  ORF Transcript_20564/g.55403 Transcript_20564/m.55403 type:complete len:226 (-) Transcript_20564:415-1092(-)
MGRLVIRVEHGKRRRGIEPPARFVRVALAHEGLSDKELVLLVEAWLDLFRGEEVAERLVIGGAGRRGEESGSHLGRGPGDRGHLVVPKAKEVARGRVSWVEVHGCLEVRAHDKGLLDARLGALEAARLADDDTRPLAGCKVARVELHGALHPREGRLDEVLLVPFVTRPPSDPSHAVQRAREAPESLRVVLGALVHATKVIDSPFVLARVEESIGLLPWGGRRCP